MKVLFIGGTGNISTASSRLAVEKGIDLYLLNRGKHPADIKGAHYIRADISDPAAAREALASHQFDAVVNWIVFTPDEIERDIELFQGRTGQYIFISSASVYQKPVLDPVITESTPLKNPYWEYSRNKIACEERLMQAWRDDEFPITIVRPSHTYDTVIPTAVGGWNDYGIVERMKKGLPIVVHGDGTSLWTVTHSDDFAAGFVGLLGRPQTLGQAFHITTDEILTWNAIYQTLARAAGTEANIVHVPSDLIAEVEPSQRGNLHGDKAWSVVFDNSKIKRYVPGFTATIPFCEGIRRTLDYFEADPERMRSSKDGDDLIQRILQRYKAVS